MQIFIMNSLKINYKTNTSELCEIGKKYDTDKSSQRANVTDIRHCHPYTLFYDGLFKNKKNEKLDIAELGILEGGSLRMWQEYFTNSNIYGFDNSTWYLDNFKEKYNNDRITLTNIDVTNKDNITNTFDNLNLQYDIIIEDTTNQFEDQIRVIENVYQYLKPGGILIIEDVFKYYNENAYIKRLSNILHHFQDYYFVELDHCNKKSTGWNNDKLFVLIKGGNEPIFKNNNKITIITPSYRTTNLKTIKNSINFDYVDEWIIVYDASKITENPNLFANDENDKIKEYIHTSEGMSGNPQRNFALSKVANVDTYIYYLDDDNIIHPSFYKLLNILDNNKMYTFNQTNRLYGDNIIQNMIDTAMILIDNKLVNNTQWLPHVYAADFFFIKDCYVNNKNNHIFVNNELCYYNKLA